MTRVLLLGAGATRGTLGDEVPVARDFGQHLDAQVQTWTTDYPYLAAVVRYLQYRLPDTSEQSWALDRVWGAIDNRIKLQHILDLRLPGAPDAPPKTRRFYSQAWDPWSYAVVELRLAVARVYGVRLASGIERAIRGDGTLKQQMERLGPGDCVISFNYDLLAENMLRSLHQKTAVIGAHRWLDYPDLKTSIVLCQPHGSLKWRRTIPERGGVGVEILTSAMEDQEIDFHPQDLTFTQPGIVGPVPFKEEIISPELQLGSNSDFFLRLAAQWRWAMQAVSEADELAIMGYGFPNEDLYARFLFADAIARRAREHPLRICLYQTTERRHEVEREINGLFQTASQGDSPIEFRGPVEP